MSETDPPPTEPPSAPPSAPPSEPPSAPPTAPPSAPPDIAPDEEDLYAVRPTRFGVYYVVLALVGVAAVGGILYWQKRHPSPDDLITQASVRLVARDTRGAIELYERALVLRPGDVDAYRGLANAHAQLGDLAGRERWLRAALGLDGLGRRQRRVLEAMLAETMLDKATDVGAANPAAYEEALEEAVRLAPKSKANKLLSDHHQQQAGEAVAAGRYTDAARHLHRLRTLYIPKALKENLIVQEVRHGMRDFLPAFRKEFEERHRARAVEKGWFDPETGRFQGTATIQPPARGDRTNRQDRKAAHDIAVGAARDALLDVLADLAGAPSSGLSAYPEGMLSWTLHAEYDDWVVEEPGKYRMTLGVSFEDGAYVIYLLRQA